MLRRGAYLIARSVMLAALISPENGRALPSIYPRYDEYRVSTDRVIPLVILEPTA